MEDEHSRNHRRDNAVTRTHPPRYCLTASRQLSGDPLPVEASMKSSENQFTILGRTTVRLDACT